MRRGGFTLMEVLIAGAAGLVLMLVVQGFLVSGFSFALVAESDAAQAAGMQAAMERVVHHVRLARGHRVYVDRAAYLANSPCFGGTPGSCLKLLTASGNYVYWLDPASSELRWNLENGPSGYRVLARGVRAFQARCLQPDQVGLRLEVQRPADASDVGRRTMWLSTSAFHRNFDGSDNSCMLPARLAARPSGTGRS